jgi:hypothetical protein
VSWKATEWRGPFRMDAVFPKHDLQSPTSSHSIIFILEFGTGAEINLVTATQRCSERGEHPASTPTPTGANRAWSCNQLWIKARPFRQRMTLLPRGPTGREPLQGLQATAGAYTWHFSIWRAVAAVKRGSMLLCYKPEGSGFDSRWDHWIFQIT